MNGSSSPCSAPNRPTIQVFRDGAFHGYQPQAYSSAQGGLLDRLVSWLARPPGVRRNRSRAGDLSPDRWTEGMSVESCGISKQR